MKVDRSTKIGCTGLALYLLGALAVPLYQTGKVVIASVTSGALIAGIAVLLLLYLYYTHKRYGMAILGERWPKNRQDTRSFVKQISLFTIAIAYLVVFTGLLLVALDEWFARSSVSEKVYAALGVGALAMAATVRAAKKRTNQRRATSMLRGGPKGIAEWNAWRRNSALRKFSNPVPPLERLDLSHSDLSGADLASANLRYTDLSYSNLVDADLEDADLTHAVLRGASLPIHHPPQKLSFADLRDTDLRRIPHPFLLGANLERANLSGLVLSEIVLRECNLRGTDFSSADLTRADLRSADLAEAKLNGAKLANADLRRASLWRTDLTEADLRGADLQHAVIVEAKLDRATVSGCSVYGVSAWDNSLVDAEQENLIVNKPGEPTVTVDDIQIAQLVHLMLTNDHVRELIRLVSAKGVLLLGRFGGGGIETLRAIAASLRAEKYLPMIFDYERPVQRNYTETVQTLLGLSRFVIVDLTGPSVPQELYATVPHFKIPFVPIIEAGRETTSTISDILEYPWVVKPPVRFENTPDLLRGLRKLVIEPAEQLVTARRRTLDEMMAG
jgi:uncharacterized protein YjbI with pentapeptide repeats